MAEDISATANPRVRSNGDAVTGTESALPGATEPLWRPGTSASPGGGPLGGPRGWIEPSPALVRGRTVGRAPSVPERDGQRVAAKRAMDVALAVPLLIASLPLLAVAALLIKTTSPGPVLFRHTRKGRGEEDFELLKLRTMVEDADDMQEEVATDANGSVFETARDDPRVTPVGKVLRKLSIDELPQLVNVLRGEMSLVGPRPLVEAEVRRLPAGHRRARARFRPGLTCLWQINGRNECSDLERLALDQRYLREWSVRLDLEILLRTIPAALSGRGAA